MSKPKSSTSWEYTAYDISRSISYYSRDGKTKIVKTIMNPFGIPPKSLVGIAAQRLGISDPWSSPLVKSLISWITLWAPGLNLICILSVCLMILIPVSYISWSNPSSGRPREELVSFHENGANYPGAFGPSAPGSRIVKSTFAPQLDNPRVARYRRQVHGGGGPEAAKTEPEPLITNLDSQLGDEKPLDLGPMTSFFNNEILDRFTREHSCTNDTTILKILLNDSLYNKHRLPATDGVEVRVEFWVQEVSSVSEQTSEFVADIYINELWIDPGLRYDKLNPCKYNITLGEQILKRIWVPNSCFINSKQAKIHDSPFKNIFLMIYPNGTVWVNYRVKVTGPCDMDLTKFPMDSQTCQLVYESFNYNMDEVKMIWMPIPEPVYPLKNITLPDYDLLNVNTTYAEVDYPAGKWIELTVVFTFKRRYVWYFLQAYIPTYLTIFLSWVSFTLGTKAIPARTMLGVNSLLAMMFQFGTIMRNLPRVSYVKAIDVWMLACMTFIFASLLELAIIGYLTKETVTAPGKAKSSEKNKGSNSISDTSNGKPFACFTKKIVIASKLIGIGSNATSNDNHNINNNSHQTRIVQNNNELWNSNNDNNSNSNNNPPLKDWLSTTPSHSNRFPVAFYDSEPQRLAGEQRSIDDLQQLPPQPKLILGDINSPNPFSVGQTIVGEEMFPKQRRPHSSTASPWRAPRLMSQDPIHNFAKVHHLEEPLVEKDSGPKEALEDKFRFDPTAGCPCCNRRKENKICNIRFCPEKIDHISSVGFPLVFSIFNITYWTYYNQ